MIPTRPMLTCAVLTALFAASFAPAEPSLPDRLRSLNAELLSDTAPSARMLRERSALLARIIREDPRRAADLLLDGRQRQRLLERVPAAEEWVEEQGRWDGQLVTVAIDDLKNRAASLEFHLMQGLRQYRLAFVEVPRTSACGTAVSVEGFRLGDTILATVARTGDTAAPPACGPTGEQKTAVILASLPGMPLPPALTPASVQDAFFGAAGPSVDGYVRDASYGRAWLSGEVFGPFTLDADYNCLDTAGLVNAAIRSGGARIDFANYDRIVVIAPRPGACLSGAATIGRAPLPALGGGAFHASYAVLDPAGLMVSTSAAVAVAAHALGHNFGLGHSNTRDDSDRAGGATGAGRESGDAFSLMGSPFGGGSPFTLGHYAARHKRQLGWLSPAESRDVETAGAFTLAPYSAQTPGLKALRIRRGSGGREWLWLEYRQPVGLYDSTLSAYSPVAHSGALVHEERPGDGFDTYLLTFYPASAPSDFRYAPLAAGAKWDDPYSDLTLEAAETGGGLRIAVTYRQGGCTNDTANCGPRTSTGAGLATLGSGTAGARRGADPGWQASFSPSSASVSASGGTAAVNVTITGTAPTWTAVSGASWVQPVQITGPPGSGSVAYTVAPNLGLASRFTVLTIAGASFPIHQAASDTGAPAGRVYTVAGLNPPAAGPANTIPLRTFTSMDLDSLGNLYLAEQWSHRIRKVTPGGQLSTIAGNGLPESTGDGGPASAAHVSSPAALVADPQGNLLFADVAGLRKIAGDGLMSTVAAGPVWSEWVTAARGPDGSIYVTAQDHVKRITPQGAIVAFAGTGAAGFSGDGGPAATAQLSSPRGLAVDSTGRVYISDSSNNRIRMVGIDGIISTVAGTGAFGFSGDNGPATDAVLWVPGALTFDPAGALVVADGGNRLRRIANGIITSLAGGVEGAPADTGPVASSPLGLIQAVRFLPDGSCFYLSNDYQVRKVDLQGQISVFAGNKTNIGDGGPANSAFLQISSVDGRKMVPDTAGNLYVADQDNYRIRKISTSGVITTVAGSGVEGSGPDGLQALQTAISPAAVAVSPAGELYFAEYARVRKILPDGVVMTVAGTGVLGYTGDGGAATAAQITVRSSMVFDAAGNLYFATLDNRIRRVTPEGTITTFAGNGDPGSTGDDGPASAAAIGEVIDIAADTLGNIYFAGAFYSGGPVLRKIDAGGIVTTVRSHGNAVSAYSIAFGPDGSLYVSGSNYFSRLMSSGEWLTMVLSGSNTAEGAPASENKVFGLSSLTVDAAGTLLFAEPPANRIRKIVFGFALDASEATLPGTSGGGSIQVIAPSPGYAWAPSSDASWLHPNPANRTGDAALSYTVDANGASLPRQGLITIGDQLFVVRQGAGSSPAASLSITKTHSGEFLPGQTGSYTVTVANAVSAGATAGAVSVSELPPFGLTVSSMSGSGWSCVGHTCTRADALNPGAAYPPITVSVNVGAYSTSPLVNTVTVSGGGSASAIAADSTDIARPLRFIAIAPCRIADTRNAAGPFGGPSLAAQQSRNFDIPAGACGIPRTAAAYALNVTVAPSGPLGYLTVWPAGQAQPTASTLNSLDGRIKANAAIVAAGADNAISVFATQATHLILDINGYFVPATDPAALAFYPVAPCRIVDTRTPNGLLGTPALSGGATRPLPVLSGSCNVPVTAQAYSLNLTVVPKGALSYLTMWPTGQNRPTVSTLNAHTGAVTANAAIVSAGGGGYINAFATEDTELVIDINGYFAPPAPGGLSLYAAAPCRALDTRLPPESPARQGRIDIPVAAGPCAVPAAAQAYVFNATVVPPAPLGYLTLWPGGATAMPLVSTLNASDAVVTSNMAILPAAGGAVSAFLSNPSHLILDTFGYFAP